MIKTHELNITSAEFTQLMSTSYKILEQKEENSYEQNDYILFREVSENEVLRSQLTQIKEIINDNGIKDGYILTVLNKF